MRSRNECGEGVVWELYDLVTVDVDCVAVSANCNLQLHCMFDAYILYRKFLLIYCSHVVRVPLYFYFFTGAVPGIYFFVI